MTRERIYSVAYQQLALDMSCSPEDMVSGQNIYSSKKFLDGRRMFDNDSSPLNVMCINNKMIFSGEDGLVSWCREKYDSVTGGWLTSYDNLRMLDEKLAETGHRILNTHCFFLPEGETRVEHSPYIRWYEKDELERFRDDKRFTEALGFSPLRPDELAVTAEKDGHIFAMAGVSSDSELLWQIGINTSPEARGGGMGKYLVTVLKNEVLRRGKIPYYGCHFSHSISQRIAIGAGFMPVWSEIYTR